MKKLLLIFLLFFNLKLFSQIEGSGNESKTTWDQGIPFCLDDQYIVELTEKIDLIKVRDNDKIELSPEERAICLEIGLAFYSRREYEAANWYFNKSINSFTIPIKSQVSASKEYVYLIKEVFVPSPTQNKEELSEISEMKKDLNFLNDLPKNFENLNKEDLSKIKKQIQNQLKKLVFEKDSLIKINASKVIIDSKDGTIKTLKKESQIIDLTIENEDLNTENKDLETQRKELRKYLIWSVIGISLLILMIIAILQRKTIKVKDDEIENQLKDISKKNTYLEHAAKIIRHDMHSGINTYMPRGISSLEKKLTSDDIKNFKLESSIKMIKEGLNHTQKVYKSVYEFTNLVKQNVVLDKKEIDLKKLLFDYFNNTSYKDQIILEDLITTNVNEILFCGAIDNLVKNGLKYNDSEIKKVKIYMDENYLIVEDNGIGMSQDQFNDICLNYKNKKNKENESGLGLNISLAILTEHGFDLTCEKLKLGTKMKIKIK